MDRNRQELFFPKWLRRPLPKGEGLYATAGSVRSKRLPTVCEEAKCPNRTECWSHRTATFLAMGKECTRACGFCDIDFSKAPKPLEEDEPKRIAESVRELGLKHVVITMVARDDLPDGGAEHLAKIIREVRGSATIEVLTADFAGNLDALDIVLNEAPEIFNYNIETTRSYTPKVRHKATYDRTINILKHAKTSGKSRFVKSGLMLGFGETEHEVKETLNDLHDAGVDIVTMGQYLRPNHNKIRVKAFIPPGQFDAYAAYGHAIGLKHVYAGPFVRSSYNAGVVYNQLACK